MMAVGGPKSLQDAIRAAGGQVGPRSKWLGSWNIRSGIGDWDAFFQGCKADGVTPLVLGFLFGDDISPTALRSGIQDRYNGVWKDQTVLVKLMTSVMLKAKTAGVQPVVACELEFSKNGVQSDLEFGKYFDRLAAAVRTCPGARVMFAPGIWSDQAALAKTFASQIANSDLLGLQTLLFAPRHPVTDFQRAGVRLAGAFQALRGTSSKPGAIYDLGFSSYGGTFSTTHPFAGGDGKANEALQAEAIRSVAAAVPDMKVEFLMYRALKDDPNFNVANFGGTAELHLGLLRTDGTRKPAYAALMVLAAPPEPMVPKSQYDAVVQERDILQRDLDAARMGMDLAMRSTKQAVDSLRAMLDRFSAV